MVQALQQHAGDHGMTRWRRVSRIRRGRVTTSAGVLLDDLRERRHGELLDPRRLVLVVDVDTHPFGGRHDSSARGPTASHDPPCCRERPHLYRHPCPHLPAIATATIRVLGKQSWYKRQHLSALGRSNTVTCVSLTFVVTKTADTPSVRDSRSDGASVTMVAMAAAARQFTRRRPGVYVAADGAEFLTEGEAAEELGLPRTTLRDLLAAHGEELPRTDRPGQRPARLIRREDLPTFRSFLDRPAESSGVQDTMVATLVDELLTARTELERRVRTLEHKCDDLHAVIDGLTASSRLQHAVIDRLNRALARGGG